MKKIAAGLAVVLVLLTAALCGADDGDTGRSRFRDKIRARFGKSNLSSGSGSRPEKSGINHTLSGTEFTVWAPPSAGRLPLLLFSHGFHGCSNQSSHLMNLLAAEGYFIVAPVHRDAACGKLPETLRSKPSFRKIESWDSRTYEDRRDDFVRLVQALRKDPSWSVKIDWDRVGIIGHSLGGYTALGLAGGWPGWKMPEIKAVIALSPYCEPFVRAGTLGSLGVPVMYQGGTRDFGITPSVKRPGGAYEQTGKPAVFVEFRGAGHFAWTDFKHDYDQSVIAYMKSFLGSYLMRTGEPLFEQRADVEQLSFKR